MKASARLVVDVARGRTVLGDVRSEPPFAIRRCGDRFLIVGSAAAPVSGDRLTVDVDVRPGAVADLGSVAATMVWPGTGDEPSIATTTIRVGDGAHLRWWPEPTISVVGSQHRIRTRIELSGSATCEVVEEYVLGRWQEPSGDLTTELRVERDGRALVHHGERFGPGLPGAGSLARSGAARHVLTAVITGAAPGTTAVAADRPGDGGGVVGARLPVGNDATAVLILAAGPDRGSVLRRHRELALAVATPRH